MYTVVFCGCIYENELKTEGIDVEARLAGCFRVRRKYCNIFTCVQINDFKYYTCTSILYYIL